LGVTGKGRIETKEDETDQQYKDRIDKIKDLTIQWKADLHTVINKFAVRLRDNKPYMVETRWEKNKKGYIRRHVTTMTKKEVQERYGDIVIFLGSLKGGNWVEKKWSLSVYLTDGVKGMRQSEKNVKSGIYFFPKIGDDEMDKINIFPGLLITAEEAKEWWDGLSPEQQVIHQEHIDFVKNQHLHVLCNENEDDHDYFEKRESYLFQKPWEKLDVGHPIFLGAHGVGKTSYGQLQLEMYGEQFVTIINDINKLDEQFNADQEFVLKEIVEEAPNPYDHKLGSKLKALKDRNKQRVYVNKFEKARKKKLHEFNIFFE
jgi:hypothetical protein